MTCGLGRGHGSEAHLPSQGSCPSSAPEVTAWQGASGPQIPLGDRHVGAQGSVRGLHSPGPQLCVGIYGTLVTAQPRTSASVREEEEPRAGPGVVLPGHRREGATT